MPASIEPRGPQRLWIVRHGQSASNVARDAAEAVRDHRISATGRDMDVALSELGQRQAEALGRWLAAEAQPPTLAIASPYLRASETARIALAAGGLDIPLHHDERLREREMGLLEGLTRWGIEHHYPEQAALMTELGKFYHRPPSGESWCDVILRLRSFLDSLCLDHAGQRVLVVCHGATVPCFRYLLERLGEREILAIDAQHQIANCSITSYRRVAGSQAPGALELETFNATAPLEEAGEAVTRRDDVTTGKR